MKGINLAESCHITGGLFPINGSGVTTLDAVTMKNYSHFTAIILAGAANGANHTVTVLASSDAAATGATAIAFTYYKTITADGDELGAATAATTAGFAMTNATVNNTKYVIEIDASELPDGKPWVNVTLSGATSSAPIAVTYVLSGSRRASPQSPSVIA